MKDENTKVTKEIEQWKCPDCDKVIESLYPKQLEYLKKQHRLTHQKEA
ncbi:Uncharacterised protein [uncultured archaeon]|nr:Uncharacterised protein [uncultured archaeon]